MTEAVKNQIGICCKNMLTVILKCETTYRIVECLICGRMDGVLHSTLTEQSRLSDSIVYRLGFYFEMAL